MLHRNILRELNLDTVPENRTAKNSCKAYNGSRRKLAIAFDLGTTFSGVSYSVLDPGNIPEIIGVTRFPSHEHVGSEAKIPTIIYYDKEGNVRGVGAEALKQNIVEQAEEEGWVKYSEFKLYLGNIIEQAEEEGRVKYSQSKLHPQLQTNTSLQITFTRISSNARSPLFSKHIKVLRFSGARLKITLSLYSRILTDGKARSKQKCDKP